MNNKPFLYAVGLLIIVVGIVAGVLLINNRPTPNLDGACTADAKLCPDGSAVGRQGPNCEFPDCPVLVNPGTLSIQANIGPNCPVETPDDPCETSPAAYMARGVMINNSQGMTVYQSNFDGTGRLSVQLPAGKYQIDLIPTGIDVSKDLPATVEVKRNETTTFEVNIDTGIR
jgi:hypothetical protein